MSFVKRVIELTFTKGVGTFTESGKNTLTLSGLRVQCNIINVNGPGMGQAQLRVFGLTKARLNDLSALNQGFMVQRKINLQIRAGDTTDGMNLIFDGQITVGQIDLNSQPDSALVIVAMAGMLQAAQSAPSTSYPGSTTHFTVLKSLAEQMGMAFEPNGDAVALRTPYFAGTLRDQVMRCADAANANWMIENNTLVVWPRFGNRKGTVPTISPDTGMVGYPSYSEIGISIKTIFNPFIRNGGLVTVKSSLDFANGSWATFYVKHDLESETPNGKWFTQFDGLPYINV